MRMPLKDALELKPEHVQLAILKALKDLARELRRVRREQRELHDDDEELD